MLSLPENRPIKPNQLLELHDGLLAIGIGSVAESDVMVSECLLKWMSTLGLKNKDEVCNSKTSCFLSLHLKKKEKEKE